MSYIADENSFLKRAHDVRNTDETRAFYNRWADTYDADLIEENDYVQPRRCAEMLSRFLADRQAEILDIGCGTGLSGAALFEAGYGVIDGCDLTPGMVAKARERGIYRRLFEADLNRPPLGAPGGAYGAAVAVGVFSFSLIHPDAMDEILRLLAPGTPLIVGLNAKFYGEGTLAGKLNALSAAGRIDRLAEEHGEHIGSAGMTGWAIAVRKAPAISG